MESYLHDFMNDTLKLRNKNSTLEFLAIDFRDYAPEIYTRNSSILFLHFCNGWYLYLLSILFTLAVSCEAVSICGCETCITSAHRPLDTSGLITD